MGLFGAITGVISGIQGAGAASDAADDLVKGYVQSADTVDRRVHEITPMLADAYRQAGQNVVGAAEGAATGVLGATTAAASGVRQATTDANAYLDPYITAGGEAMTTLRSLYSPGGEGTRSFTVDDMRTMDPGYDFRMAQAQKALERSAAARGSVLGGGMLRSLNREIQGVAEQGLGAAFDRFTRGQQQRFDQLTTIANGGLQAGTRAGDRLTRAAEVVGDLGVTGERVAGDYRVGGTRYASDTGIRSAESQAQLAMDAGLYRAGAERGVSQARAGEHLGRANAWNQALGAVGGGLDGFVSGGLSGGKGFRLGDAFRGFSRA